MTYVTHPLERPYGRLVVLREETARFDHKPLVLLLHGAFEKHKKLLPWSELWRASYDVALADLPGHGQSDPPSPVTMDSYIDELRWLVGTHFKDRRVVIVGDSFGGLLGVALGNSPPPNLAGAVALDPLLATAKQWSIMDLIPRVLEGQPEGSFRRAFAANVMGMAQSPPEDRRYYHYIEGVRVPAIVLAGAEALGVRRDVTGPSLLDDDDRAFLTARLKLAVIPGVGHQLVLQRPAETFAAAEDFVRTL
ncbi:MAG: alpha/beta fold hydrolase [Rhodospirillaceae bacterium]